MLLILMVLLIFAGVTVSTIVRFPFREALWGAFVTQGGALGYVLLPLRGDAPFQGAGIHIYHIYN